MHGRQNQDSTNDEQTLNEKYTDAITSAKIFEVKKNEQEMDTGKYYERGIAQYKRC